jgi:hypothetical protein
LKKSSGVGKTAQRAFVYMVSDGTQAKGLSDLQFEAIGVGKSGEYWAVVLGVVNA